MPKYNEKVQDLDSLEQYLKELKREAQRLELQLDALKSDHITSMVVRNNTIGVRGLRSSLCSMSCQR